MQRRTLVITFTLFLFAVQFAFAQTADVTRKGAYLADNANLTELSGEDWTIYSDAEKKVFYVDFESLKINLSDIIVKNDQGEILLQDDVFELPVNTIYELDFSQYKSGKYLIELRSFTGIIRKSISIM